MDEPRHDFLARSGFAGQQHRGFRLRYTGRMGEHILPLTRVAHYAALTGSRLELASKGGDLRFEPRGRFTRSGVATLGLGQMLMGEGECEVVRHAAREVNVLIRKAARISREEKERPEDRVA